VAHENGVVHGGSLHIRINPIEVVVTIDSDRQTEGYN
jgi:hypothetical protein